MSLCDLPDNLQSALEIYNLERFVGPRRRSQPSVGRSVTRPFTTKNARDAHNEEEFNKMIRSGVPAAEIVAVNVE